MESNREGDPPLPPSLVDLPDEVIVTIFRNLHCKDLYNLMLVSQKCYRLTKEPSVWHHISVRQKHQTTWSSHQVEQFIVRLMETGQPLRSVQLCNVECEYFSSIYNCISNNCRYIERMLIRYSLGVYPKSIRELVYKCLFLTHLDLQMDTVSDVVLISECRNLVYLGLFNGKNSVFGEVSRSDESYILTILKNNRSLTEFVMFHAAMSDFLLCDILALRSMKYLSMRSFTGESSLKELGSHLSLERLQLEIKSHQVDAVLRAACLLPNLQKLHLDSLGIMRLKRGDWSTARFSALTSLTLQNISGISAQFTEQVAGIIELCPILEEIVLMSFDSMDDIMVIDALGDCETLKKLILYGMGYYVTCYCLSRLLSTCPNLNLISINECKGITKKAKAELQARNPDVLFEEYIVFASYPWTHMNADSF